MGQCRKCGDKLKRGKKHGVCNNCNSVLRRKRESKKRKNESMESKRKPWNIMRDNIYFNNPIKRKNDFIDWSRDGG
jgi:hypothetical protein